MNKIAYVTGSRADYGIVRQFLNLLNHDADIELRIIATGALLDQEYGHQVDLIYEDGFIVDAEIDVRLNSASNTQIVFSMAEIMRKFADYFDKNHFDLLIILGDRYEMLSVAVSAAMEQIPILHIHGGEATYGNYDEFIRHCITKMGLYHFTATEEYQKRVIQLGEHPNRVFCLGALGAENCLGIDETHVPFSVKQLETKSYFVILLHPETLTKSDVYTQVHSLFDAIGCYSGYRYVFLGTNADTNSNIIRREVKNYVENSKNSIYFENIHSDAYHYLLKNSICLIGNSSSGIIEAPSLGIYTINIGERQYGRVRGNSIIDVKFDKNEIMAAIENVLEIYDSIKPVNPYYKENTAYNYYCTTKTLLSRLNEELREPKTFYDMEFCYKTQE